MVIKLLIVIFLFFIIFPIISISAVAIGQDIYKRIRKSPHLNFIKFIAFIMVFIVGLGCTPILPFMLSSTVTKNSTVYTGKTATITYDEYDDFIRYIHYDDQIYQELIPSISPTVDYDISEEVQLTYGKPIANVLGENQTAIEKYLYKVFKYPVNTEKIYPVTNENMSYYVSLDGFNLFCNKDVIDKKIKYYEDTSNYNYYMEDYNTGKQVDISIEKSTVDEITQLAYSTMDISYNETDEADIMKAIPEAVQLEVDSDYDYVTVMGESKDKLILRHVGEVYVQGKDVYQIIEEVYRDDGTTALFGLKLSDKAAKEFISTVKGSGV